MNKNEYFYVSDVGIANKKQSYINLLLEMQFNNSNMSSIKDELNQEIIKLNEEIIAINEELKNINQQLSKNDLDIFVFEEDFVRLMKPEYALYVTKDDIDYLANIIEILKNKRIELIGKRKLLIAKKKLLKEKINNNRKRIKDINIDIKYNNLNMLSIKKSLYRLDDIALSEVDVVKESEFAPKIKKRRNK